MRRIATAIVALALLTSTASAQGNKDADKRGGGQAAAAAQGGDQGQGQGRGNNADRGRGENAPVAASARGSERRGNSQGSGQGSAMREQRGNATQGERGAGNANRAERAVQRAADDRGRGNGDRAVVVDRRGAAVANRLDRGPDFSFVRQGTRGLITGCPPGLARKNPPCVPPGQVPGPLRLFAFDRPDWWGLSWLDGGRYFYDDGYLVRIGPDGRIASYVPLLGGALSIGNPWPGYYAPVPVPDYYVDYYGLGPYDSYRYADNVIYRVDPDTAAITSIAALLTGDQFVVGEPMPLGYDVYNVPYGYRDQYYDTPDAMYRYSDGYVYQVDPETQLIAAAIELLAA
jgi:hypothetical protein